MQRRRLVTGLVFGAIVLFAGIALVSSTNIGRALTAEGRVWLPFAATANTPASVVPDNSAIVIDARATGRPIDQRIFGSNLPAWLGPQRLRDDAFIDRVNASGVTVVRMPGGSWSNGYDWLACELGDEEGCYWTWAARPSDFVAFAQATGQEVMWTVSANRTTGHAAALVAFFNGDVNDERVIGVDVRGRDWGTVGDWARLRRDNGHPEPLNVQLWQIGNELYGGKEGRGKDCWEYGWEDVWTCDGTEYVYGIGSGADRREGFLEFRNAMRAVDSDILVGAIGVAEADGWSNWGNEVIAAAGAEMDFYDIHYYPFTNAPSNAAAALTRPQSDWPSIMADAQAAFERHANGRDIPVAITEYNLIAWINGDNRQLMVRAVNALFIADSLGQMAQSGYIMANLWNIANGAGDDGRDYGMFHDDTYDRYPHYYVFPLWRRFGNELLPVASGWDAATTLSVYAGRDATGAISLLAINKTGDPIAASIEVTGGAATWNAFVDALQADSLTATEVTFNGNRSPANDLSDAPSLELAALSSSFEFSFAPYSVTLLRLSPGE